MPLKNFWYSYKNILLRSILRKNYFVFLRKVFGTLYKFLVKFLKINFSNHIINLDKLDKKKFKKYDLDKLFFHFNCDKGSFWYHNHTKIKSHNYSFFYEKYFKSLKNKRINILEIGSHEGRGIASFYFFFPKANLVGANINPFQMKYYSKRITELFVDVSSREILKNLADYLKYDFDIIIDDASHNLRDILITLPIFFKKLKKDGYYVIEDANQFKIYKELNPYNEVLTPLNILSKIKNDIKFHSKHLSSDDAKYLKKNIKTFLVKKGTSIVNGHNISDIIFLRKK